MVLVHTEKHGKGREESNIQFISPMEDVWLFSWNAWWNIFYSLVILCYLLSQVL